MNLRTRGFKVDHRVVTAWPNGTHELTCFVTTRSLGKLRRKFIEFMQTETKEVFGSKRLRRSPAP
jgi:hypothetical protein